MLSLSVTSSRLLSTIYTALPLRLTTLLTELLPTYLHQTGVKDATAATSTAATTAPSPPFTR